MESVGARPERRELVEAETLLQGLSGGLTAQAVALVATVEVVVEQEVIEVGLDLADLLVPGGASLAQGVSWLRSSPERETSMWRRFALGLGQGEADRRHAIATLGAGFRLQRPLESPA